jgi:hypothetical protein
MDVNNILDELRQEREMIEEAILSMERLARGRGKRRGRPPAWMKEARNGHAGGAEHGRRTNETNRIVWPRDAVVLLA